MEEKQFRNKVSLFGFFFSILVVWAHSYNAELFLGKTAQGRRVMNLERIFGDFAGQIAVPGFFLLSAYLFYRNFCWKLLPAKWLSRGKSVLFPYFLWNGIYYLGYVIGSRLPLVSRAMGRGIIVLDFSGLADAVLNYRYLYTFWYMQQLIFFVLLAPLLYLLLKRVWSGLLFLGALFVLIWASWDILPYVNEDALFYYGTGAFLALHGRRLERGWSLRRGLIGAGLIGAAAVNFFLTKTYFLSGTTVLYRVLMPLGLWMTAEESRLIRVRPWMQCNFFLYAVHFALVRLINKTAAMFVPPSAVWPVLLYLTMPVLVVGISYGAAAAIKRYMPVLWSVLNGGR